MPNSSTLIIIGHIGKDAEVRTAGQHQVVSFSVALTRKRQGKESTTWFRCDWFGERAVKVMPYLTKGKAVQVVGELYEDTYEKDGVEKKSLKVDVRDMTLLGGREKSDDPTRSPQPSPSCPSDAASFSPSCDPPF